VQNNWRPNKQKTHVGGYNISVTEVVWQMHQAKVVKDIAEKVDIPIEGVQFSDKRCFGARTAACKTVFDNALTPAERQAVGAEVRKRRLYGNPPDIQARQVRFGRSGNVQSYDFCRIAEQKFESRLDKQTTDNFKELGVYTVAFVVFTRPNGQLGMAMWVPRHYIIRM
jgi:hypothetical protein